MRISISRYTLQQLIILIVLVALMVVLSVLSSDFLTFTNLTNVIRQIATVVIVGSAATLLMITGNIDLSVGSVLALTGVAAAKFVVAGLSLPTAFTLAVLVGLGVGAVNGVMVAKLQMPPVIATLGTMYAARGIAFIISDGKSVNVGLPPSYDVLGRGFVGAVPLPAILLIIVFIIFLFVEKRTTLGKYCFAIGGNKTAAILSGINVNSIVIILYTIVGCLAGLAGIIMSSRLGVGQPSVGIGFEFDVIVAIVLGGTSLAGGKGSLSGMLIGALIVGFLSNGLNLLNVQSFYQEVFKGLVLVGAVILDNTIKEKLGKAKSLNTGKLQAKAEE